MLERLEQLLILHCSPTLAGLKTANLFNYGFTSVEDIAAQLDHANQKLNGRGIYIEALRIRETSALILAYRPKKLAADLQNGGVVQLLEEYGYTGVSVEYALSRLKERLAGQVGFPHEIGLFLGYPLEDVAGFIKNNGKECKCVGCWKVYGNECAAAILFARYKKCADVYSKLFAKGYSITRLTVAA